MPKRQNAKLLEALQRKPMTALEIWQELGIARASARVFDLREEGHDIRSTEITVLNRDNQACRVALYSLGSAQRTLLPTHPGRGVMAA
ncbi:MAG TPA: helix-turn-helix domain-containing protein [Pseudoxanthomonas sp.]|nr:helix-turn-helix domain-containing protein [Pseudoxanthomonas sp.]